MACSLHNSYQTSAMGYESHKMRPSKMYKFLQDEQGAAAIEYSLLASLIGMMIVGALQALGGSLFDAFSFISSSLTPVQEIEDPRSGVL